MSDTYYKDRAKKLFRNALEADRLNEWLVNLKILSELADDAALMSMAANPDISLEEKALKLAEGMGDTEPGVLRLLSELIERNKFLGINDIADEYKQLLEEYRLVNSTENVLIKTAVPLDEDYLLGIRKKLTEIRGKPIILKTEVDPSLIGGMILKIGEQVIDGSIRNKLQALKSKISKVR